VLVEVTSDSSEEYDTGLKFEHYRTIPSLDEYIIISHRERRIVVHRRSAEGQWSLNVAVTGESVRVESIGAQLRVDEIYRNSRVR
jgi:Uma2 family endonuclease